MSLNYCANNCFLFEQDGVFIQAAGRQYFWGCQSRVWFLALQYWQFGFRRLRHQKDFLSACRTAKKSSENCISFPIMISLLDPEKITTPGGTVPGEKKPVVRSAIDLPANEAFTAQGENLNADRAGIA